MFRITALTLGILALFYSINVKLGSRPAQVVENDEEFVPKKVKKVKKRAPASVAKKTLPAPTPVPQLINETPQMDAPEPDAPLEDLAEAVAATTGEDLTYSSGYSSYGGSGSGPGRSSSSGRSTASSEGSSSKSNPGNSSSANNIATLGGGSAFFGNVPYPPVINNPGESDDEDTAALTCSSNKGGGAYGNPISVTLTCSSSAKIKYCVSEGACCDPKTEGVEFTSDVVIGSISGNYCLSFYGDSSTIGQTSLVTKLNYTVNNNLPDIQTNYPQTFFQTTQLSGRSYLKSNDFNKPGYEMGQISLKSHNPGPTGLNVGCGDIVSNYVSLPAPTAAVVMAPLDMSSILLSQQVNVPFNINHLIYGDNYVTSYVVNRNYASPLYSCSTDKINLMDFEYFQADVSHASPVVGNVREFSGSFSVYGFFEADESNVYRGPAGSSSEDQDGRSLKSGLFSIFF